MSDSFDSYTICDQVKSRARTQRYNTRMAFNCHRREKHPEARHWRKWAYSNNGLPRRSLSCGCCPKKYANRRRHGNHTCNGYMGDICPSTHALKMKKRTQIAIEISDWEKVNYDQDSFINADLLWF